MSAKKAATRLNMLWLSAGYFFHLWIRMAHDKTYEALPAYKNYSDKKYTNAIHKAVLVSFILSMVLFLSFQYLIPSLFKPKSVNAGTNSVTWDTKADFDSATPDANAIVNAPGSFEIKTTADFGTSEDGALVIDGGTTGTAVAKYTHTADGIAHNLTDGAYGGPFNSSHPLPLDTSFLKSNNKYNFTTVILRNGAYLTHSVQTGPKGGVEGIELFASDSLSIDATSSINLDGKGNNPAGKGGVTAHYTDCGMGGPCDWYIYGGGSNTSSVAAEKIGSAGGGPSGNLGGGRILLSSKVVTVEGTITAKGQNGDDKGQGSGGSIVLKSNTLNISNSVSAPALPSYWVNPDWTPAYNVTAGGVGKIAIAYANFNSGYPLATVNVDSASGSVNYDDGSGGANAWVSVPDAGAYSGTQNKTVGLTSGTQPFVTTTFTGKSIQVLAQKNISSGKVNVYVDNQLETPTPIDLYENYQVQGSCLQTEWSDDDDGYVCVAWNYTTVPRYKSIIFEKTWANQGSHTVKVEATSEINPSSSARNFYFDAFVYQARADGSQTDAPGAAAGKINPQAYYTYIAGTHFTTAKLANTGGATTGLKGSLAKNVKWSKLKLFGEVRVNTNVKIQARVKNNGTWGSFVNPDDNVVDGWSTRTVPANKYDGTVPFPSYEFDLSAKNLAGTEIEINVQLTGDGSGTPTMDKLVAEYDYLNTPAAPKQFNGATEITNGFTNASSIGLEASIRPRADSSPLTPQIELVSYDVDPGTPTFTGNNTTASYATSQIAFTAAECGATDANGDCSNTLTEKSIGTLSGLATGKTYYWQVRMSDGAGKMSDWSSTNATTPDKWGKFTIEQTAPTLTSSSVNSGATYTKTKLVTVTIKAKDTGANPSGLSTSVNLSNDGSTWNNWASTVTWAGPDGNGDYTGTVSSWDLSLFGGNNSDSPPAKNVYVMVRDNAGNLGGMIWTAKSDWESASGSQIDTATTNGSAQIASNPNGVSFGSGVQGSVTISSPTNINTLIASYDGVNVYPQFTNLTINSRLYTSSMVPLYFKVSGTLTIGAAGSIDANSAGYTAASGPGAGASQRTVSRQECTGPEDEYGECPSQWFDYPAPAEGGAYVYTTQPNFGSGGGNGNPSATYTGGSGGGKITIFASNISSSGTITAKGGDGQNLGSSWVGAGGSGGGILIKARSGNIDGSKVSTAGGTAYGFDPYGLGTDENGGTGRTEVMGATVSGSPVGTYQYLGGYEGAFKASGTLGGTSTGLRFGNPALDTKYQFGSVNWLGTGITSTFKVKVQVRAADFWGSGDAGYVNPSTNDASWFELTSNSGNLSLHPSLSNYKTLELRLELTGDGDSTPVLDYLSLITTTNDLITLDTTPPQYSGQIGFSNDASWVKEGTVQVVTATFNENMANTPQISIDYSGAGPDILAANMTQGADATAWTYSATTPAGNDGTATVIFIGNDLAGNSISGSPTGNTFKVDNSVPTGSVTANILNATYKDPQINVPYTAADTINQITGYEQVFVGCYGDSGYNLQECGLDAEFIDGDPIYSPVTLSGVDYANLYYKKDAAASWTKYVPNPNTLSNATDGNFKSANYTTTIPFNSGTTGGDGVYKFKLVAVDNAGNSMTVPNNGTAADDTTVIDTTAPTGSASFTQGSASATATSPLTLSFSANDTLTGLATYQLSEDGVTWETTVYPINGAPTSYTSGNISRVVTLDEGAKYAYVKVTDVAGNSNTVPIFARMAFDLTNPTISATTGTISDVNNTALVEENWYSGKNPKFTLTGSDGVEGSGVKGFWVYLGNDANGDPMNAGLPALNRFYLSATNQLATLNRDLDAFGYTPGHLYLRAKSVDNVDRTSNSVVSFIYNYDKTAPQAAVTGLLASTTVEGQVELTWPALDIDEDEAPIENFKIERIKYSIYTGNSLTPNGLWKGEAAQNITNGYGEFYTNNATGYTDNAANTPGGQPVLLGGVRYIYRISYKDTANAAYSPLPTSNLFLSIGFTKDMDPPTTPTGVHAYACNGVTNCTDAANRGHEIFITWTPSSDGEGSGIGGYLVYRKNGDSMVETGWDLVGQTTQTTYYDNDASNLVTNAEYKTVASPPLNDYTYYSYRVVAFDLASDVIADRNTSGILPISGDILDNLNWHETVQTPDVTAPAVPVGAGVRRDGIDGGSPLHQQLNVYWDKDFVITDNNPQGIVGTGFKIYQSGPYLSTQANPASLTYVNRTANFTVKPNSVANSYITKGLDDYSYYYFYVEVYDNASPSNTAKTSYFGAKTGNSQMPGSVTNVTLDTTSLTGADLGYKANLTFYGGNTPGCQASDGSDCVTSYEVYLATTNIQENCGALSDDECWIDQNGGTPIIISDAENKTKNLTGKDYHYTFENLTDASTYFVRIRAKANTTDPEIMFSFLNDPAASAVTPDVQAPASPGNVKIKDIYDDGLNFKRNIITWQRIATPLRNGSNDFKEYRIYRSTDGLTFEQICQNNTLTILRASGCNTQYPNPLYKSSQEEGLANNYFIDLIPVAQANQYYYYYVTAVDNAGTQFKDSRNIVVYPVDNESQIPRNANGTIAAVSLNPAETQPHITTLSSGKKAEFPQPAGVTTATVRWETDQPTDAMVMFRNKYLKDANGKDTTTPNTQGVYKQIGSGDSSRNIGMATDHTVGLFGLMPRTTYEYVIVSRNFLSNPVTAEGSELPTLTTEGFEVTYQPAKIQKSTVSVTLFWTTNMPSNTNIVEYRETNGSRTGSAAETPLNLNSIAEANRTCAKTPALCQHSATLDPLKKGTEYTFRIISVSLDNYNASSGLESFTTTNTDSRQFTVAPSASNVAERSITSTSAQVVFQTSEPTTATLKYGNSQGGPYTLNKPDPVNGTTHQITLDGLEPGKTYYYVVEVSNGYMTYTSPEGSFKAVLKPKIENLSVADVTPYSFTLNWTTNIETDTLINLGTSAAYGEKRGKPGLVKTHSLLVEQLTDDTEYHYQILAKDETGAEVAGPDAVVRTPMDREGPKITNVKTDIMPLGDADASAQVIISWATNKPATTKVEYDEGIIGGRYTKASVEDLTLGNTHTVIIKGLNVATTYHYRIVTTDKRGNTTISNDYTFVTPTKEQSIWQLIVKSLQETFSWTKNIGNIFKRK